jgi:protein SCO1
MKRYIIPAAVLFLAGGCRPRQADLPYYLTPELTPEWVTHEIATDPSTHRVGYFKLESQRGNDVTAASLEGKITVAHFFFTRCRGVCPRTQPHLSWLLRQFPSDPRLQILSHSVMAQADSIPQLLAYAREHHITDSRWLLLTGNPRDIETLATNSYFANLNDGRSYGIDDLAHTETVFLVDQDRHIRGVYNGTLQLEMERLRDDIRQLAELDPT